MDLFRYFICNTCNPNYIILYISYIFRYILYNISIYYDTIYIYIYIYLYIYANINIIKQ